ncbi:MAG: GTP binding translation elongation factor [Harvfovirus sp.]|uniref:GTP binding translation elongation factor n=1 Tax=Harvfovirus sp. TaxID=2487768 RepID=A0A3G5A7Y3_9VIRU|nr:MAG: GTP binding translation elongation factor [Harvfovirus sp.]
MSADDSLSELGTTARPLRTEVAIVIAGSVDVGKCFAKGTKVIRSDGRTINVEDIKAGDTLMGDDSTPRTVLATHTGRGQLYRIKSENFPDVVVNGEHILCLKSSIQNTKQMPIELSVNNFLKLSRSEQIVLTMYTIPMELPSVAVHMDPYEFASTEYQTIPDCYKYNSKAQRHKFLLGLAQENDITSKMTKELFSDVQYIVRSLGYVPIENSYRISNKSTHVFSIVDDIVDTYYGFSLSGNKRFLLGDFRVAHNSTFIGVMKYKDLDDGNGSARIKVAKHPHEKNSGKTSDISTRLIECDDKQHGVTFVDVCGHEKFLKTTTYGINGYFPDYGFVIIAANRGILKMTREHLGILFYLEMPVVILITRVDLVADSEIYTSTLNNIVKLCKNNKKQVYVLNSDKEMKLPDDELKKKVATASETFIKLADNMSASPNIVPILTISSKTGYFLDTIRAFVNHAKPRKLWDTNTKDINGSIFYIDQVFNPHGIGVVISGILKGMTLKIGDILHLGPRGKDFAPVRIKSIHNDNRQDLSELTDHQRGCLAITCLDKKIDFNKAFIGKGMIGVYPESFTSKICYNFKAEIDILHHSSTIRPGYAPFIHAGPVCQTARLMFSKEDNDGKDALRTGDTAIVNFKFKFKPEFIETYAETGRYFFFREGTTRGRGKIISITKISDDPDPTPDPISDRSKRKYYVKGKKPR